MGTEQHFFDGYDENGDCIGRTVIIERPREDFGRMIREKFEKDLAEARYKFGHNEDMMRDFISIAQRNRELAEKGLRTGFRTIEL